MSRIFEHFNQTSTVPCPLCGLTTDEKTCLVPIYETEEGNNIQAIQIHLACLLSGSMYFPRAKAIVASVGNCLNSMKKNLGCKRKENRIYMHREYLRSKCCDSAVIVYFSPYDGDVVRYECAKCKQNCDLVDPDLIPRNT